MAQKKTALVVGLGLIGGSVAMALRGFENYRVVGTDCSSQTRSYAAAHGVCDEVAERVEDVLGQADVVLFAMRPHGIAQQIEAFRDSFKPGALVTDVGGIKGAIMEAAQCLPDTVDFIGCHPMAGKETSGVENAEKELFHNAHFILTPGPRSTQEHVDLLQRMGKYMGFRDVVITTPEEHDAIIAYTSQLMHIIAVATCDDEDLFRCKGFEGGSFRGCTRVAALDVPLWTELFTMNAPALCRCIRTLEDNLRAYREVLERGDREQLVEKLTASARRKRKMNLE
ncbi:MAG: prephenate dehydrogenase [Clostridiales bacterium]|mgnify:FL=1|nr:prephenate dehydrogenase [Clostridiales bacterium]